MKYNNKKRVLKFLLWICVMACITGIPWGFIPLQKVYSYIGFNGTPSYMTQFLFTQQSLFFSFFSLYFLLLKKDVEKYKEILSIGTCLIAFMGCFMYVLKCRTGMIYWSSIYEPFIWLFIGSSMFLLNLSIKTKRVNKKLAVSTCKCTARKVKEYFRKNTQKGYENLVFLLGDGLFCQQLW